ncbi:MAG: hypothetical protein NTW04_05745 [Elusimicrobia bacterium]|nr:hypothetical protein [Elusimicrobiota bacterium]
MKKLTFMFVVALFTGSSFVFATDNKGNSDGSISLENAEKIKTNDTKSVFSVKLPDIWGKHEGFIIKPEYYTPSAPGPLGLCDFISDAIQFFIKLDEKTSPVTITIDETNKSVNLSICGETTLAENYETIGYDKEGFIIFKNADGKELPLKIIGYREESKKYLVIIPTGNVSWKDGVVFFRYK